MMARAHPEAGKRGYGQCADGEVACGRGGVSAPRQSVAQRRTNGRRDGGGPHYEFNRTCIGALLQTVAARRDLNVI
jgi:hypothetical protein